MSFWTWYLVDIVCKCCFFHHHVFAIWHQRTCILVNMWNNHQKWYIIYFVIVGMKTDDIYEKQCKALVEITYYAIVDWFASSRCQGILTFRMLMISLWLDDTEMPSPLLGLCEGNPPVTTGFLSQRASKLGIDVFVDVSLNSDFDGILPKGLYPPCLRMADRALLAGYPRIVSDLRCHDAYVMSLL